MAITEELVEHELNAMAPVAPILVGEVIALRKLVRDQQYALRYMSSADAIEELTKRAKELNAYP